MGLRGSEMMPARKQGWAQDRHEFLYNSYSAPLCPLRANEHPAALLALLMGHRVELSRKG